ncbi:hypothetical protein JCM1393_26900 [Clostridium carnis]
MFNNISNTRLSDDKNGYQEYEKIVLEVIAKGLKNKDELYYIAPFLSKVFVKSEKNICKQIEIINSKRDPLYWFWSN